MDSYQFHFERMSNLDLHPLSLPVSRLSPAKSSSSIDQYTHHHSKGDSAYSSFSGGSTVPDYPSPFLLDELQSHSLHYTDPKYAKAKYSPTFPQSDSKSMDHLYRSMEAIVQQHNQSSNVSSNIESPPVPTHPLPPPPPPVRLDSFVTTRNLENSRARQSPEGQFDDISTSQTGNPEVFGVRAEPGCGHIFSQNCQRDLLKEDLGEKDLEPPKSTGNLSRLALQTCQQEHLQQSLSGHSETQRKRSHSAYGGPVSEQQCYVNSVHMPQNMISGSIQHKGEFYFVTGVFKSSEPSVMQSVGDSASMETSSEWSYKAQRRRQSCPSGPSGRLFFQEVHKFTFQNEVVEHPSYKSEQTSQGVEDQRVIRRETGRHHSSSHPIFYCGPEDSLVIKKITPAPIKEDHSSRPKNDEQMTRNSRPPQLDVPSEKISKETTPLLYHLTGANRASFTSKFKNNSDCGIETKSPDCGKDKQKAGKDGQSSTNSEYHQSEMSKEEQPNDFSYPCGTLDDSYKKYYKEKLKDAQSKVLRATSFKRKDLQLSWPHRIKQQTNKKLSVIHSGPQSQQSILDNPTPQLHKPQGTEEENIKDLGQEIEKGIEKEMEKPQNIAQPQVPRVGSRKRLTADQKKLSHSEPEKLHQLSDEPAHTTCRSLGNEGEGLLSEGDYGLVAARRKMLETRGRALSASNFSKSSLKHLQHKALVAYMERKTGQKVAEPQQPVPQVPNQRNSTAGRLSDSSSRQNSGIAGSKKLYRPLSAGRILDSVSSSVKYAQFITAQPSIHSRQSSSKEESSTAGKSASVESLLDQPEQPEFFRARSTSTPHVFHVRKHQDEFSTSHNKDILSFQRKKEEDTVVHHSRTASVPDDRWARMIAPRGKSMEELGVGKISNPKVLSKSSEQLDQQQDKQAMSVKEKRISKGQEHMKSMLNQSCSPMLSSEEHSDKSQAGPEKQLSKKPSPTPDSSAVSYSQLRALSSPPDSKEFHSIVSVNHIPSHEDEINMALHRKGTKNRDDTVVPMSSHTIESGEIKRDIRKEQEVSHQDVSEASASAQDISLSLGVTTDPSLWISTPETNELDANNCRSTETTIDQPRNAVPNPCSLIESTPITTVSVIPGVESSETPALSWEQNGSEKEDGSLVSKNKEWKYPKVKLEWEVLVQEVVSADQSLARSLYPLTNRKTALMLMEQLLSEDTLLMEEHYKIKQEKKVNNPEKAAHSTETPEDDKPVNPLSSLKDDSALSNNQKDELCNTEIDIIEKKRQLIAHIEERLKSLEEVGSTLQVEEKENVAWGNAMETLVRESCVPAELERYTQFIGDLERVVSLLLCLSARLARVQNALRTVDDSMDAEEKQSLDNRHRLLCKQRDDAKDLKDNLHRREHLVSTFLSKQLTDTQLQEYRRFIQTKASLLIRQKDLDEKQRLGEEQLEALLNSIPR